MNVEQLGQLAQRLLALDGSEVPVAILEWALYLLSALRRLRS
jgi:hypothetical protein